MTRRLAFTALLAAVALTGCNKAADNGAGTTTVTTTETVTVTATGVPSSGDSPAASPTTSTSATLLDFTPCATSLSTPCDTNTASSEAPEETTSEARSTTALPSEVSGAASPEYSPVSDLELCYLDELPTQVEDAVVAIENDGPYLRPRDDGGYFGNREGILPREGRSYYREYTVEDPGDFPGPRRIVTGGQRRSGDPAEVYYYTDDHYDSFCELVVD